MIKLSYNKLNNIYKIICKKRQGVNEESIYKKKKNNVYNFFFISIYSNWYKKVNGNH